MTTVNDSIALARSQDARLVNALKELLAIPSISALPDYAPEVARAAEWLVARLREVGVEHIETIPTAGHPIVYAETVAPENAPTILVYGHYDVQPVDPLNEWVSDPFNPDQRGENLHARGASDMKGSLVAFLHALEACRACGGPAVRVRFLLEGEEEIGSLHLPEFIEANRDKLAAEVCLNLDGEIHAPDLPSISYALRGLAYFELELRGPRQDLHSGVFGGSLHNPAQALCELIAAMHDAEGRVTLPGFYDDVLPLEAEERAALARVPMSDEQWCEMSGVSALWGETGYTTLERVGARPTLEVNGIVGGFTGYGAKTVLPARALAKISTRLVPNQRPERIRAAFEAWLKANVPPTVSWELRELSSAPGCVMQRDSRAMRCAVAALRDSFGAEPIFKREGGSVPVVSFVKEMLNMDSIMMGFRLPDDGIHGPNEKQHVPTLLKGVEAFIRFLMCFPK